VLKKIDKNFFGLLMGYDYFRYNFNPSTMISATTNDVKVIVETFYKPTQNQHLNNEFVFAYRITIENYSDYTIQLMRRHWQIIDTNGQIREVEGEGVVGEQPVIQPHEFHQYTSYCNLKSDIGKMRGDYKMKRHADGKEFLVAIPEFLMMAPFRMN
jgi:ApaG protein